MIRRRVALIPLLLTAGLTTGACTTFTDNDAAARVGDTVLSQSDFDELATALLEQPADQRIELPANVVQGVLNTWIVTEIVRGELVAAGVTPTTVDPGDDPFTTLATEQQALFTQWDELPPASDEQFRAEYERGPDVSGVICTSHVLTETEADADAVLDELAGGAEFASVAAERSTDPGSAANGGSLGCSTVGEFSQSFIPEFVDAALDAEVGVPTEPVESSFGHHVILVRPFDEIADDPTARAAFDQLGVRFRRSAREADVRVDPRYGAFNPDTGVVPLGPPTGNLAF